MVNLTNSGDYSNQGTTTAPTITSQTFTLGTSSANFGTPSLLSSTNFGFTQIPNINPGSGFTMLEQQFNGITLGQGLPSLGLSGQNLGVSLNFQGLPTSGNLTTSKISPRLDTSTPMVSETNPTPSNGSIFNFTDTPLKPFKQEGLTTPVFTQVNQERTTDVEEVVRIRVQPQTFQVVNYNIYPAPELEFAQSFNEPITIQAFLVYDASTEIPGGFTNGTHYYFINISQVMLLY